MIEASKGQLQNQAITLLDSTKMSRSMIKHGKALAQLMIGVSNAAAIFSCMNV